MLCVVVASSLLSSVPDVLDVCVWVILLAGSDPLHVDVHMTPEYSTSYLHLKKKKKTTENVPTFSISIPSNTECTDSVWGNQVLLTKNMDKMVKWNPVRPIDVRLAVLIGTECW